MRLFVGIPLADTVEKELLALCAALSSGADGLRWQAPESWHITLQFLGNATPDQFACLTDNLTGISAAPVPVRLGGLGIFERVGVLLAEVELTPELQGLQQRVTAATAVCGFVAEDRPYRPHITLARARGDGRRQLRSLKDRAGAPPRFTPFTAPGFLLYESHLGPGGSRYEVKARFALDGEAGA